MFGGHPLDFLPPNISWNKVKAEAKTIKKAATKAVTITVPLIPAGRAAQAGYAGAKVCGKALSKVKDKKKKMCLLLGLGCSAGDGQFSNLGDIATHIQTTTRISRLSKKSGPIKTHVFKK